MSAKLLPSSLFLLSFGFFSLFLFLVGQRYGYFVPEPKALQGSVQIAGIATYSGQLTSPVRLLLPSLGLDLAIVPVSLQGKKWPTTPSGVSYLSNSAIPGEAGNAVFYGHNWPSLLGRLNQSRTGEKLVVTYADGLSREFTINNVFVVGPNSTEILASSPTPKITLYTCTGFLDTQRLVVTAI